MKINDALANSYATAYAAALDADAAAGYMEFYTGTQPAGPNTAVTSQTKLGTVTFSVTAGSVAGRVFTFGAVTQDSAADATGTATWARAYDGAGVAVSDHSAGNAGSGPGGADPGIVLNTADIVAGGPIQVTSGTVTF